MTITIYMKPAGCFGCDKTKALFTAQGVPFVEVDITTNEAALEYITEELQYAQAPVVVYEIDGSIDHWSGLNPPRINQVIALEATQHLSL
ncbi:glutaredoxin (plasmid) [Arthrobacter sp. ERGS1:01]|uniref:glutaredoxin family protein n=1 Tax=Arthrobacter sp. ERGS1:01 TaxID=1704044 RepID=UPI0006B4461E|nr:glutaredoxin family protein [Arthrobacter sp. ERGS1:01]ALE04824.1 glutaredoxin [Arthrobacter sp. ERGS1:01]